MSSSQESPTEFTFFPKLPKELRFRIWRATMRPRLVEIKFETECGFYSIAAIPKALFICQESRSEALRHYSLCFGSQLWYAPKTYVNLKLDMIYLSAYLSEEIDLFFTGLQPKEAENLRYLAIDDNLADVKLRVENHRYPGLFRDAIQKAVEALPALKELALVKDISLLFHHLDLPDGGWRTVGSYRYAYLFRRAPRAILDFVLLAIGVCWDLPLRSFAVDWHGIGWNVSCISYTLAWPSDLELHCSNATDTSRLRVQDLRL